MCTRSCSHVLHSVLHRNISPNSLHPSSADAALAMTYPKASAGIMKGDSNGVRLAYTVTVFTPPPFGYKNAAVLQFIHWETPLLPPTPLPPTSSPPLSLSWRVTLMIQPNELSEMETLIYPSRWVSPLLCKKVAFCRIGPERADKVRAASLNHRV